MTLRIRKKLNKTKIRKEKHTQPLFILMLLWHDATHDPKYKKNIIKQKRKNFIYEHIFNFCKEF